MVTFRFTKTAALVLVFFAGTSLGVAGQGPRIQAVQMRHDLGKIKAGERAEHLFEIRNSGDEVLLIQKIQST